MSHFFKALHCFPSCLNSSYDIAWTEHTFYYFADVNFVVRKVSALSVISFGAGAEL